MTTLAPSTVRLRPDATACVDAVCASPADLNRSCFCITLDHPQIAAEMEKASGDPAFYSTHIDTRRHLFSSVPVFLPDSDRDVYRGDKLTRSTGNEILASSYIAQEIAPPSERTVLIDGQPSPRKMDVRLYVYDGELLLAAARLYRGQTTNFRTEGGGFAPVHFLAN